MLVVVLLAGCVGSGSGAGNTAPVADAGPDQTVFSGSRVLLDGSGSSDADGDSILYLWTLISKPQRSVANLSSRVVVNPTFMADVDGDYVFELIVSDGVSSSSTDRVTITAAAANTPPVANAGADQSVPKNVIVVLDGSASTDAEGNALSYRWTLTSVPSGSAAALSDAATMAPLFLADLSGTYIVSLTVNDGIADSAPDLVTVTASNTPPVADAGADQTVTVGKRVMLDGTASQDDDGDSLVYQWTLVSMPAGSTAALANASVSTPTFTADVAGDYEVSLVVNDGEDDSGADVVVIRAVSRPLVVREEWTTANLPDNPYVIISYYYDDRGNLVYVNQETYDSVGYTGLRTTEYTYDSNDHKTGRIYTDFSLQYYWSSEYQTDDHGNITRVVSIKYDLNTHQVLATSGPSLYAYVYDAGGKLISKTYPSGDVETYVYDSNSNLIKKQCCGTTYTYLYDSNNYLIKETELSESDGSVGWWIYTNDADGNPVKRDWYYNGDRLYTQRYYY